MLKAILVDFDGTLVDTAAANAAAYSAALAEAGVSISDEDLIPRIEGRSWRDFLPPLMPQAGEKELQAVTRSKRRLYSRYFDRTAPNRPLLRLLRSWKAAHALGLVTTASRESVLPLLSHHRIDSLFDVVICGEDVTNPKPSPEAYFKAADCLRVLPFDCLVFEDSDTGVAAAQAFGGHVVRWEASAPEPADAFALNIANC